MNNGPITTLFLDIGGVLLTNGWDRKSRKLAVEHFKLDWEEIDERHHLTFDTYEEGKLSLDEYLGRVIFHEKRDFSKEEFIEFMYAQSLAYDETIEFFKKMKKQYQLKVIAVNNEGRELHEYRAKKFRLNELFDAYISSCYVHLRKPDKEILTMACNISQTPPASGLYVDDRLMFVEVALAFGLHALHYKDLQSAKEQMEKLTFHSR